MNSDDLTGFMRFMERAENLKNTLRSGRTSLGRQESSAEHSWRLALMVLLLSPRCEGADPLRLLELSLVHDLAEAVCGDVPAVLQKENDGRAARERAAMFDLCADLPGDMRRKLHALRAEYEEGETLEAVLVKGMDKLETLMQHNQGKNSPEFDYAFNLRYARKNTDVAPLLSALRERIDAMTRSRIRFDEPPSAKPRLSS